MSIRSAVKFVLLVGVVLVVSPVHARHGGGKMAAGLMRWGYEQFDQRREKCPDCFGTGMLWMPCPSCGGAGCFACGGFRIVRSGFTCDTCNGSGKKPIDWGTVLPVGLVVLIVLLIVAHKYGILKAISDKYF